MIRLYRLFVLFILFFATTCPFAANNSGATTNSATSTTTTTNTADNITTKAATNIELGQQKSQVCAACHGADGNSVVPQWPSIAGQPEKYLVKELKEFRKGDKGLRFEASMYGMTQNLTDDDIANLAAYFASQTPKAGAADQSQVALGEKIYRGGIPERGVPACGPSCHGIRGEGLELAGIPRLSGQQSEYTIQQLNKFKNGSRSNDTNSIMRDIAKRMTDEEMKAVSSYVAGVH